MLPQKGTHVTFHFAAGRQVSGEVLVRYHDNTYSIKRYYHSEFDGFAVISNFDYVTFKQL